MGIKQLGGVFGRNPTFNDVTIEGQLTFDGDIDINSDLKIDGDLDVTGNSDLTGALTVRSKQTMVTSDLVFDNGYGVKGKLVAGTEIGMIRRNASDQVAIDEDGYGAKIGFGGRYDFAGAGDFTVGIGNVVIGTSGKGIDFSATAGTGTSELFDDYEEGVWTSEVGGTATYGDNTGRYTKIGRQVFATFDLNITTIGTGSTTVITGLPFAVGDAIAEGVSINFYDSLATNVVELNAYVINSEIRFRSMSAASSGLTDLAVLGDGCRVTGTAIYTV